MSVQGAPSTQPGQGKRLLGSLFLPLGVGLILETSYQWSGIGIILVAVVLVVWGWQEHWRSKSNVKRHE